MEFTEGSGAAATDSRVVTWEHARIMAIVGTRIYFCIFGDIQVSEGYIFQDLVC